jgi:RNA polymerase sigma-70 factor (ECF subfamily)
VGDVVDTGDRLAAALVRSQREADADAFAEVVVGLSAPLHSYLARRAGADADDLLAEVWLHAFAARRTFDPGRGSARVWSFGIARHVLLAHWRRLATATRGLPLVEETTDPWPEVDDRLAAADVALILRDALAELPAVERELLLLVAWDGLTPTEAAAVAGIPAPTARTRLFRARQRIRDRLDDAPTAPLVASEPTRGVSP